MKTKKAPVQQESCAVRPLRANRLMCYKERLEAPWRLPSPVSIVVTNKDDGQKLELETPIDRAVEVREHVNERRITSVDVNRHVRIFAYA